MHSYSTLQINCGKENLGDPKLRDRDRIWAHSLAASLAVLNQVSFINFLLLALQEGFLNVRSLTPGRVGEVAFANVHVSHADRLPHHPPLAVRKSKSDPASNCDVFLEDSMCLFGFKKKRAIEHHLKSCHLLFSRTFLTNTFLKTL